MPRFMIEFEITTRYKGEIEAPDEESAESKVREVWNKTSSCDWTSQDDPLVYNVQPA